MTKPLATVPHTEAGPTHRPAALRILPALRRRLRLFYLRLRHPRARFGAGCDIRSGFHMDVRPTGAIDIGPRCVLDRGASIESEGRLTIGPGCIFGHHCTIGVRDRVEIGPDCLIAELVSIRDHDHRIDDTDRPIRFQGYVSAPVIIGRNVWLGCKVTIVKGVTIGDNAVIGANAVVTHDIPANAIAVGVPAEVIRFRVDSKLPK
jgi:acetyltransferase-like isoleucine patch superfamily enzyme